MTQPAQRDLMRDVDTTTFNWAKLFGNSISAVVGGFEMLRLVISAARNGVVTGIVHYAPMVDGTLVYATAVATAGIRVVPVGVTHYVMKLTAKMTATKLRLPSTNLLHGTELKITFGTTSAAGLAYSASGLTVTGGASSFAKNTSISFLFVRPTSASGIWQAM